MRTKLSPAFVASATALPGAERSIYWDADLAGFGLQVTAAGHKSFVCQYRAGKRSRRVAIKATLKLGEARKEAKAIFGRVAKGHDPLAERRKKDAEVEAERKRTDADDENSVKAICESYFEREGKKLRNAIERHRVLQRLVYPKLGARQIGEVKRSEIVRMLDHIEDENGPVMADRTMAYLRRVFAWHATRTDDFSSPFVRGMARTNPKERAGKRTLADDELRAVWAAAGEMNNPYGPLVRFILLTAARRNEAAMMPRSEIGDAEIEAQNGTKHVIKTWTLPAARNKSKQDHAVPLSNAALAVLNALPVIGDGHFVFTRNGKRPIRGFAKFKQRLEQLSGVTGFGLHDLRRTARTLLSRAGVGADIAERCLGHVIGGVRETYDRHSFLEQKRIAYEALAAQIERIINPQENVVPFRAAP